MTDRECLRGDDADRVGADAQGQATETSRRTALKLAGLATVGGTALTGAVTSSTAGASGGSQSDDGATQVARLTAPEGAADDQFGHAIDAAQNSERVIVGAPVDETQQRAGAAYVYDRVDGEWTLTATLTDEAASATRFGASVALDASGETAVVGAPQTGQEGGSGAAHVFEHSDGEWTRTTTFAAEEVRDQTPEPRMGAVSGFGASAALDADGQTALIGAPYSNRTGASSGTAYQFARDGDSWTMQGEVRWPGGDSAGLGADVALAAGGDRGVVGVPNSFPGRTGQVGIVEGDVGEFPDELLTTDDEAELNVLGSSVATDDAGARLLAGAPATGAPDDDGGAIYEFVYDGEEWTQAATVAPDDLVSGDACGDAADLDAAGTTALFGAPQQATSAGAAYAYTCDGTWTQTAKLRPEDGQAEAEFGAACVLDGSGTVAFVGAPQEDTDDGETAGAVYVFDLEAAGDGSGDHGDDAGEGDDGSDEEEKGDDGDENDGGDDGSDDDNDEGNDSDDGDENDGDENDSSDGGGDDESDDSDDENDDGEVDVEIAVQPDAPTGPINPRSREDLPVAILQSGGFDPTDDASGVDVSTVRVGTPDVVGGASLVGSASKRAPTADDGASPTHDGHVEDVDGDGDDDLLVHVPIRDVGLEGREATLKLVAETHDGREVVGTAAVDVLHCGL